MHRPIRAIGALAGLAALIGIVVRRWSDFYPKPKTGLLGYFVSVRLLLVVAVGGVFLHCPPGRRDRRGGRRLDRASGILLLLVMAEPLVKTLLSTTKVVVRNLPGVPPVPKAPVLARAGSPPATCWPSSSRAAAGRGRRCRAGPCWCRPWPRVPLTLLTIRHALRATAASKRIERDTPAALRAYAPAFVVYYATVQGARYQLGMWLPYLERLNKPYVVITRNPATVAEIARLTKAPILVPRTDKKMSDHLDSMVVPSMKAAFYVQGSAANSTFQRYPMTHVWLNHGDSDKQANYHPAARHVQQAVRVRTAGRRPLRRPRHRGAARAVRDRRSAADRVDHGPRRAAAARHPAHHPLRADLEGRSAEHQLQLVAERSDHDQGRAGAGIDGDLPTPSAELQRPYGCGPDQGHPRAAGRGPHGQRAAARVGQEGGEGVGRRRPASTPPTP